MRLSSRLNNLSDYVFVELNRQVRLIEKKTGKPVLNLAIGNPNFPPNSKCLDKLQGLVKEKDAHHYPGYKAIPIFSTALSSWYKDRFGVVLNTDELLPLNGSKDGITHLMLAVLNHGDEVLIPDPGYPAYTGATLIAGGKPVYYNLTSGNNFKINVAEVERKITKKTKLIWLNFPSNPTGQVVDKTTLEKLAKLAYKHHVWLAYDNAYSEVTFTNYSAPSILEVAGAKEVAVEFGSMSKTFSLAGWRVGWVVGNKKLTKALATVKSQFDSGLSLPLQKLTAFCLNNYDKQWHEEMLKSYYSRAVVLESYLKKLGLISSLPKASFYIWAKIPAGYKNSESFAKKLLEEKQILVVPGTAFGRNGKNYIRVSISSNLERIDEYFN